MARIRTVKPEFFTSPDMADLDVLGRLTYIGLWTHVDDQGVCLDDPRLIHAALYALDDTVSIDDVADVLDAYVAAGLCWRYSNGSRSYLQVIAWHHQLINRPSKPKLPAHDHPDSTLTESSVSPHGTLMEGSLPDQGTGKGTGTGNGSAAAPPSTDLALIEPTPIEKPAAPALRQHDALFDALCEACGMEYHEMTDRQRTSTGVARGQLAKVGATPDEVRRRAAHYKLKFPNAPLTPNGLANQWAALRTVVAAAPAMSKSMAGHLAAGRRLGIIEGGA